MKTTAIALLSLAVTALFSGAGSGAALQPAEIVDPMIGAADTGSCPPGPVLPHASIYPSPNTIAPMPSGYKHGSDVIGFAQLHAQGAGPSTLSFGNFLISPQIGPGRLDSDHQSPVADMAAKAYSWRGRLEKWGIDCTVVPSERSAIYEFVFPASEDARIYFDVARKLGKSAGMTSGSLQIDLQKGTVSGGGTFDGNWNPAPYNVFFYAEINARPVEGGTWVGEQEFPGKLAAATSKRQPLGGWLRFDTRRQQAVRLKIAISFTSVEKAREFLRKEIPAWDSEGLETRVKAYWNKVLSVVQAPGIGDAEARKLYTSLFHSLVQPRDRTGDAKGWPATAPFWDDHYTTWDTWLTLFPLLSIIQPQTVASVVNSYAERYERNGRAETAFIQGKDFQVGQGGDEVDLVIGDAFAKRIPGIDWKRVWKLLESHADRRTDDYRRLGYVSSDGPRNGYDGRMRSGSSTLAFAYQDWVISRIAEALGQRADAEKLRKRSENWRNVWDDSASGDGFHGFVRERKSDGSFRDSPVTSGDGFYQGTGWNYSFNVPHERDAMIEKMGGREKFLERLEFAYGKRQNAYVDFTNEVCFQATWLFAHAGRPDRTSYWANELRNLYGENSFPGDEDSGAMSSLYFFLTAGFFPVAGQDYYYLHGPRIPRLEFHQPNGKTFAITAQNAGGDNIYVQSATLNGVPLDTPILRHRDVLAGATLAFVMGPKPSEWGKSGYK